MHPLDRKIVGLHISLVEDQDKREPSFIQDTGCIHVLSEPFRHGTNRLLPASVEHVGHESGRSHRSGGVNDVGDDGREAGSHSIGYNGSRGRPGENLDLPRSVQNHVTRGGQLAVLKRDAATTAEVLDSVCSFLNKVKDLVKLGCKEVESGENAAVRP